MTTISCIYNCKFQKDGSCTLNSDSKIVNSNSNIGCPYYVEKEKCDVTNEKGQKKPLSHFSLQ